MPPISVGDCLPSIDLYEGISDNIAVAGKIINLADICKNKKVVIFGVPGAFTPGCSKTHLPGFIERANNLKAKGVNEIICVSVNDPFVMTAWGKLNKAGGKVRMLADPCGALAKALDLAMTDVVPILGNLRFKRFSLVAVNGKVTQINAEEDETGLTCSLASILKI